MAEAADSGGVTLLHRLRHHAAQSPERIAYTFLHENGEAADVSYRQLAARVAALAALLARHAAPGERALLLCPPGVGFVNAFFACLAAGLVAVPVAPAHRRRDGERLAALLADARPAIVLGAPEAEDATRAALARAGCAVPLLCPGAGEPLASPDTLASLAALALPASDALAFLQYTSGSTAQPKGVEITHANIAANVAAIGLAFGFGPDTIMVSWLPPFHDMGLIGSIAAPLALGFRSVLMAPGAFLRRPALWLETITRYRATCSGAPNFAWDLCVRRIGAETAAQCDLSSLEVLYNGAEPVRAATLARFMAAFGPIGLRRTALFPCYGMAEATLLVAGGPHGRGPRILHLDAAALESGRVHEAAGEGVADNTAARSVVSCGALAAGVTLAIVDPESGAVLGPDAVGEILIGGPGVSRGYHGQAAAAAAAAAAVAATSGTAGSRARLLPSGDLGFLHGGELFVTGRRKDVIIVHGRNLYAQDVEELVERAAGMTAPNCCAAFAIDGADGEGLAVVVEASRALARGGEVDALGRRIRSAVAASLGIPLHTLAFAAPGAFPRTTSGKVQRGRCKALLAAGALPLVRPRAPDKGGSTARADVLIAWLRQYAARRMNAALDDERRSIAPHQVLDLGNRGLFGLQAPRALGGQELLTVDLVRVMAQLAAIDLTLATVVGVHNGLGLRPLLRAGNTAQRQRWLPALAAGRQLAAFALSEPQAGSHPRAIGTRALRVDGGWRLEGEKHLIGLASWSGVLNVFARAFDPAGRALGTVALLVPEDAPGLVQEPEALTMGMRAMVQNAVSFENVFVPDAQVLGMPGAGMEVAQEAMGFARLGIGALCVGAMRRCAQLMARYAARRDVAGGRLLDNAVTAWRLHDLDCAISAAESLVQALACALDGADSVCRGSEGEGSDRADRGADSVGADGSGALLQEACSACKCVLSELLWHAADDLMQMLGGRDYLENNIAPRLLRDARVLRILEGPSEALYAHLGAVVRVPGNPLARCIAGLLEAPAPALAAGLDTLPAQGSGQWQDWRNGEFAAWTLLAACARGEAAAWATRKLSALRAAIGAEGAAALALPSPAALLARADAHTLAIGDIEQALPGAAYGLDPLLRRAAPAAGGMPSPTPAVPPAPVPARAPAPASSPSIDLVRACLLKWLRESAAAPADLGGLHLSTGTLRCQPPIEVGLDTPFGDLGIDSLASVPLALELEAASGIAIGAELLYDYPTVRALALYIDSQRDAGPDAGCASAGADAGTGLGR